MPRPLLIISQSDYLIKIVDIDSHTEWQTMQIQISWLLQKPTDLDLHCLQRQGISGFSRTRVKPSILKIDLAWDVIIPNICVKLYWNPSMNVGTRAMTKFFLKIATVTVTLRQVSWKSNLLEILSYPTFVWTYNKNPSITVGTRGMTKYFLEPRTLKVETLSYATVVWSNIKIHR